MRKIISVKQIRGLHDQMVLDMLSGQIVKNSRMGWDDIGCPGNNTAESAQVRVFV